jgi:hypothetical protein
VAPTLSSGSILHVSGKDLENFLRSEIGSKLLSFFFRNKDTAMKIDKKNELEILFIIPFSLYNFNIFVFSRKISFN